MTKLELNKNTGFIEVAPKPLDFVAGAETGIADIELNPSGDWTSYLPTDERQKVSTFDTMACVSFSALNVIETVLNFKINQGILSTDDFNWLVTNGYVDINNRVNFSDRFTAKMSGTTTNGNSLPAVADSIRNHGLLPQKDWEFIGIFEWSEFYKEIPQELKDKALQFKNRFEVKYEWIGLNTPETTTLARYATNLRKSPLQVATAVCPPWNTSEILLTCGFGVAHATSIFDLEEGQWWDVFDHYDPFRKRFALDYTIPYAMGFSVNPRVIAPPPPEFHYYFTKTIYFGERSEEVKRLQFALKVNGVFNVEPTGYYGEITRKAVIDFQRKYQVASESEILSVNGRWVGPKTRAKLNELYGS